MNTKTIQWCNFSKSINRGCNNLLQNTDCREHFYLWVSWRWFSAAAWKYHRVSWDPPGRLPKREVGCLPSRATANAIKTPTCRKKYKFRTGFDHRSPCPSRQSSSLAHPVWSHHTSLQSLPTPSNPSFNSETCFCQEKIHKCHLQSVVHFICHLIRCQLYIERGLKKSFLNNGEERGLACV